MFLLAIVLPFTVAGLCIVAGVHYVAALAIGAFLQCCIGKALE